MAGDICFSGICFCNLPSLEILEKGGTTSEATASTVSFKLFFLGNCKLTIGRFTFRYVLKMFLLYV